MLPSRATLVGVGRSRYRVTAACLGLLAIATGGFLADVDASVPLGGLELGTALLLVAAGIAAYAGWSRGGALTGTLAVFLTLLWMAFVPPVVGYLRGEAWAGERYSTVRVSDAMLTPVAELETAIRLLPFYATLAVLCASGAFGLGAGARTLSER